MSKITIEVDGKNVSTVMNILENLKTGLIKDIKVDASNKSVKPVSSSLNSGAKKYLSKDHYKQKLLQEQKEDEFLAGKTSSGKYLSSRDYKRKLIK